MKMVIRALVERGLMALILRKGKGGNGKVYGAGRRNGRD